MSDSSDLCEGRSPWRAAHRNGGGLASEPAAATLAKPPATLLDVLDVADRLYERTADVLEPLHLSYAAYELLEHLHQAKEPLTVSRLAAARGCRRSTLDELVGRLERDGLVLLAARGGDVEAALTPRGRVRTLVAMSRVAASSADFAAALDGIDRAELERLLGRLRR